MTKEEFLERFEGINKTNAEYLRKEAERLFDSGGIDTERFDNSYLLPKIIMFVALENAAAQWDSKMPLFRGQVENLRHF